MENSKQNLRECIKCRASLAQDPTITLHRFPKPGKKNSLRCLLWAKYSCPNEPWSSREFQRSLFNQRKMLCSKHFRDTCFVGNKLFKTTVPGENEYNSEMDIKTDIDNLDNNPEGANTHNQSIKPKITEDHNELSNNSNDFDNPETNVPNKCSIDVELVKDNYDVKANNTNPEIVPYEINSHNVSVIQPQISNKSNLTKDNKPVRDDKEKGKVVKYFKVKKNLNGRKKAYIIKTVRHNFQSKKNNCKSNINGKTKPMEKETILYSQDGIDVGVSNETAHGITKNISKNRHIDKIAIDVKIFKCINCNICVTTSLKVIDHLCKEEMFKNYCNVCKEWFQMICWLQHQEVHKDNAKIQIIIEPFYPKTIAETNKKTQVLSAALENEKHDTADVSKETYNILGNLDKNNDEINQFPQTEAIDCKPKKNRRSTEIKNVKLFKCIKCEICVTKRCKIPQHSCSELQHKKICNICKEWFHYTNWVNHQIIHENKARINIIIRTFEPKSVRKIIKEKETKSNDVLASDSLESRNKVIVKNIEGINESQTIAKIDLRTKKGISDNKTTDVMLFKCTNCYECYLSKWSITKHNCTIKKKTKLCNICGQTYAVQSFRKHLRLLCRDEGKNANITYFTPRQYKYGRIKYEKKLENVLNVASDYNIKNDFISNREISVITDYEPRTENDKKNTIEVPDGSRVLEVGIIANINDHDNVIDASGNDIAVKMNNTASIEEDIDYNVYSCGLCDIVFILKEACLHHMYVNNHNIVNLQMKECPHCKLQFVIDTLINHECECPWKNNKGIRIMDLNNKSVKIHKWSGDDANVSKQNNDIENIVAIKIEKGIVKTEVESNDDIQIEEHDLLKIKLESDITEDNKEFNTDMKLGNDLNDNKIADVKVNIPGSGDDINLDNANNYYVGNELALVDVCNDLFIKKHLEYKIKKGVFIKNPYIPIGVFFKCDNCDLHFVNANLAVNHSRICRGSIFEYKCNECRRYFRTYDIEMHRFQHLVARTFNIYVISPTLAKYLLCKCPKCNICYTEDLFWKHLKCDCDKKCMFCPKCKLYINKDSFHDRYHEDACREGVVINYIDESKIKQIDIIPNNKSVDDVFENKKFLFLCNKCKCYIDNYDDAVKHAQSHIRRSIHESVHCMKCDRFFETDYYKEHHHNIDHYIIFEFDYKELLNDAWFDMFKGISKVEKDDILKNSIFTDTRRFNLKLVRNRDAKVTLYVCVSCNKVIDKVSIEKHAIDKMYCWENREYECYICKVYFCWNHAMRDHRRLHCDGLKREDFRIISIAYDAALNRGTTIKKDD